MRGGRKRYSVLFCASSVSRVEEEWVLVAFLNQRPKKIYKIVHKWNRWVPEENLPRVSTYTEYFTSKGDVEVYLRRARQRVDFISARVFESKLIEW